MKTLHWRWKYFERKEEKDASRGGKVTSEFAHWLAGTGVFAKEKRRYAWEAVFSMDAQTWWIAFFFDTLLAKVLQMLINVLISAAPTERKWSLRNGIHTKLKNRMKVDTALQVTFIKNNLMLEISHFFKIERKEKQLEEGPDQETNEGANAKMHYYALAVNGPKSCFFNVLGH